MTDTTKMVKEVQALREDEYRVWILPNPSAVRTRIRKHLTTLGVGDNIVLSVSKDRKELMAYRKQKPYVTKLEDMLREMMMSVESEALYDKAMRLLEEKHG